MTQQEIARLGPALAAELSRYRGCFLQKRSAAHFDTYCRGLLSDLPRKSVEPIARSRGPGRKTPPQLAENLKTQGLIPFLGLGWSRAAPV